MGDREENDGTKLFVYGVAADIPRDLLMDKFEKFGRVKELFNSGIFISAMCIIFKVL